MEIEILLQSLALWGVALFSLRVALAGNPLHRLIDRSDTAFLLRVDELLEGRREAAPGTAETEFLRRFSRLVLLELLVLGLELGMLFFYLLQQQMMPLVWALLGKDLLMVLISAWGTAQRRKQGLFSSLRQLPPWMIAADRVSAGLSAAGFLLLLLGANHLLPV